MDVRNSSWMALVGAAVGGAVGSLLYYLILKFGFDGLMIPGAMLGMGAGMFRNRSIVVAVVCGLAALALGIFTEWYYSPFLADRSLGYFITHLYKLNPVTLVMIVLGGVVGFWCPFPRSWDTRRERGVE